MTVLTRIGTSRDDFFEQERSLSPSTESTPTSYMGPSPINEAFALDIDCKQSSIAKIAEALWNNDGQQGIQTGCGERLIYRLTGISSTTGVGVYNPARLQQERRLSVTLSCLISSELLP